MTVDIKTMMVLVLSDIHDHIDKLQRVVDATVSKIEAAIFCGDLVSGFTASLLPRLNVPISACLGNNDEDQVSLVALGGPSFSWVRLSQEFGRVELNGRKIAFCHYPKLAELLAKTGDYDAVFYGHTHTAKNETIGRTLLLNPGAVCGINFSTGAYDPGSYALYDSGSNSAGILTLS